MENDDTANVQKWADQFLATCECPECHGQRLNREALSYRILDRNIAQLSNMDLSQLREWINYADTHLDSRQKEIAAEILKEIGKRIDFLLGAQISVSQQAVGIAVRRRKPAHKACHTDRFATCECPIYT